MTRGDRRPELPPPVRRAAAVVLAAALVIGGVLLLPDQPAWTQARPTLYWGSTGQDVRDVQWRLRTWGYYQGPVDGYYGAETYRAVVFFQQRNGLVADGVVGPSTWAALGLARGAAQAYSGSTPTARSGSVDLLARVVAAEATGEPFAGQVAVAAVVLNRVADPQFPNTLSGVVYQPHAFESVSNGLIWRRTPSAEAYRAAEQALNGWDPSWGALFFWNPAKPVSPWIWSRTIITRIGNHVFAR